MERKVTYEFDNDELWVLSEALQMLVAERMSHSYWVDVSHDEVKTAEHLARIFMGERV